MFVDTNALAARALLRAATLFEQPDLHTAALATVDYLWDRGHGREAMSHYLGGPVAGLLADQAEMAAALLDAYEVSGERAYLARARLLADWALEHLRSRDGRFADRPLVLAAGSGSVRDAPLPVLEGGAEMADDLTRLAAFSGVPAYREEAARALAAYAPEAATAGPFGAAWALAVKRFTEHPAHIVIVGRAGDPQSGALQRAALRVAEPLRSVQLLDPDADAESHRPRGLRRARRRARGSLRLPRRRLPRAHLRPRPLARARRALGARLTLRRVAGRGRPTLTLTGRAAGPSAQLCRRRRRRPSPLTTTPIGHNSADLRSEGWWRISSWSACAKARRAP